jgi:hypothetical protein
MNDDDKVFDLLGRLESKYKADVNMIEKRIDELTKNLEPLRQRLQEIEAARTQGVVPVGLVSHLIQLDGVRGAPLQSRGPARSPHHRKGERLDAAVRFFLNRNNVPAQRGSIVKGMPGFTRSSVSSLLSTTKTIFEKIVKQPGDKRSIGWKLRDDYFQVLAKRAAAPKDENPQVNNPESVEGVG